jgi:protein O-GlcNAc transferase
MSMPVTIEQAIGLHRAGRLDEAEAAYRTLLAADALNAAACHWLGMLLHHTGRLDEAHGLVQRSVQLSPNVAEFHSNFATVLGRIGRHREALEHLHAAIRLRPDYAEAWHNTGVALESGGRFDEALAAYDHALTLRPDYPEAHTHRGNALRCLGRAQESIAAHRRAIELRPDHADAYNNLAMALGEQGDPEGALACYQKLLKLCPHSASFHSNLLVGMHYVGSYSAQELFEEALRWGRGHGQTASLHHGNDRSPQRRLRVGYVSPDLRDHPIGRFMEPTLEHHDRKAFEVFCYSDVSRPDAHTDRLRSLADAWHTTIGMADEALGQLVRDDRIDILVDLTGHFAQNRLTLFARGVAPVQVAWGYPDTVGFSAMGYRITDVHSDPPGLTECFHTEQLVRLPDCAGCYRPPAGGPRVGPLPALAAGHVTFGCLNNPMKMSSATVFTFAAILNRMPGSQLLLIGPASAFDFIAGRFARHGVEPYRLEVASPRPRRDYFELYNRVDIALDPFPYNGDNTTCDALWMGVPVITLAGETFVSRRGLSNLANVGFTRFVARSTAQYVQLTASLAGDLPQLAHLRAGLRERMRRSPLCDGPRFVGNLERSYRHMWELWCARDR